MATQSVGAQATSAGIVLDFACCTVITSATEPMINPAASTVRAVRVSPAKNIRPSHVPWTILTLPVAAEITATLVPSSDSTVPPGNDQSAIVATLPASKPGTSYTAIARGTANATGIGVVEVYDLDRSLDSKLANLSNRGFVQTGDNVLFAGNIVLGQSSQKVIIRALDPSVPVPGSMADPTLELRDANGALLEANDNWMGRPNKQAIIDSTIPSNNLESAIVRTLAPANYTAIVRGVNNSTGLAVVEVHALS
jgi:hypothetical protein